MSKLLEHQGPYQALPGGQINCRVRYKAEPGRSAGWLPYTASADDPEPDGRVLYEEIKARLGG